MNEQDRKDTHGSIERYLATGEAKYPPVRPTLAKGLGYYHYSALRWLRDTNWHLQEIALTATSAVITTCLEAAERIYMIVERNGRKGESAPRSRHD